MVTDFLFSFLVPNYRIFEFLSSVILRDSPCDKDMIKTGTPSVFLDLRCQGVKPVDNRVIPWWL